MAIEKHGKIPVNARITIDYSKGDKPKINFGYPDKNSTKQNEGGIFLLISALIVVGIWVGVFYYSFAGEHFSEPSHCNFIEVERYNLTMSVLYPNGSSLASSSSKIGNYQVNITCDNNFTSQVDFMPGVKHSSWFFSNLNKIYDHNPYFYEKQNIFFVFLIVFLMLFSFVFIAILDTILVKIALKNNWIKKKIPSINKVLGGRGYMKTFNQIPKSKVIELPLFKNIYLDYNATEDFSKYLQRVEIREHEFDYVQRSRSKKIKNKKKNIYLWNAKFYFSQSPKNCKGGLELFWK